MIKGPDVAIWGFQVVWEKGVPENAGKMSKSRVITLQNLTVTKTHLLAKNKLPSFYIFNTVS